MKQWDSVHLALGAGVLLALFSGVLTMIGFYQDVANPILRADEQRQDWHDAQQMLARIMQAQDDIVVSQRQLLRCACPQEPK